MTEYKITVEPVSKYDYFDTSWQWTLYNVQADRMWEQRRGGCYFRWWGKLRAKHEIRLIEHKAKKKAKQRKTVEKTVIRKNRRIFKSN